MHLFLEQLQKPNSYCDSNLLSLSWMGRVPDQLLQTWDQTEFNDLLEEDAWRLNRINYYEEGWLASGNQRGMVGVTYSSCRPPPTGSANAPFVEDSSSTASDIPGCSAPLGDWAFDRSLPARCNYNLRGHRSEVVLVRWNEPYQKLATVDSSGVIFVWTKYEGRWSIELINDRATQVMDFAWSHDGRLALICYVDGFLLIGSVAGQRYWSSALSLDGAQLTCGVWTPDDRLVLVGLSSGCLLAISLAGTLIGQYQLREQSGIQRLAWSCGKFRLDEDNDRTASHVVPPADPTAEVFDDELGDTFDAPLPQSDRPFFGERKSSVDSTPSVTSDDVKSDNSSVSTISPDTSHILCVCFEDGELLLLRDYDDPQPKRIRTHLLSLKLDWSEHGQVLAVAGHRLLRHHTATTKSSGDSTQPYYENMLHFYCGRSGRIKYRIQLPYNRAPVTALTWAHNDKRLFVATGNVLHVAWITKHVASLQLLARLAVHRSIRNAAHLSRLGLPEPLRLIVHSLFARTLRCPLPSLSNLRRFVFLAPPSQRRLHCTLIRHAANFGSNISNPISGSEPTYVLYIEYLGGLVPILKGKRISQFKPEFVIYDPIVDDRSKSMSGMEPELDCQMLGQHLVKQMRQTRRLCAIDRQTNDVSISHYDSFVEQLRKWIGSNTTTFNSTRLYWMNDEWNDDRFVSASKSTNQTQLPPYRGLNSWLMQQLRSAGFTMPSAAFHSNSLNSPNGGTAGTSNGTASSFVGSSDYLDEMPESRRLLLITANLWGTRFKILSLVPWLPPKMCSISYRTSLLHLQPRQMSLRIKELCPATNFGSLPEDGLSNPSHITDDLEPNRLYRERINSIIPSHINSTTVPCSNLSSLHSITNHTSSSSSSSAISSAKVEISTPPPPPTSSQASNPDTVWGYSVLDEYRAAAVAPTTPRFARRQISDAGSTSDNESAPAHAGTLTADYGSDELLTLQIMQDYNGLNYNLHLQCPNDPITQNTISTQTSFPSLVDTGENQCSPHSSGSTVRPKMSSHITLATIADCPAFLRTLPIERKRIATAHRMPTQRHSMDFSLCRRFTLKREDSKSCRTGSNQGTTKTQLQRLLRNRMYLDEEYDEDDSNVDAIHQPIDGAANQTDQVDACIFSRRSNTFCGFLQSSSFDSTGKATRATPERTADRQPEANVDVDSGRTSLNTSLRSLAKNVLPPTVANRSAEQGWRYPSTPTHQRRRPSLAHGAEMNMTHRKAPIWSSTDTEEPIIEHIPYVTSHDVSGPRNMGATARSLPASPLLDQFRVDKRKKSLGRSIFYSPVMLRKAVKKRLQYFDCSSDDDRTSDEEADSVYFERGQGKREVAAAESRSRSRRWGTFKRPSASSRVRPDSHLPSSDRVNTCERTYPELHLRNKAPVWNELSQVYQLDFGGRVTQESAKNFQIEHQQRQVLQFGRIDTNTYTLDFQHPFSALQALSVALANVTQRLK